MKRLAWVALVVVVIAAGAGGYIWWQRSSQPTEPPAKVVVVFAMPGEDQAVTAQLVAEVDTTARTFKVIDGATTVTIPGTSYSKLRDAYPFGGAEAVATALLGDKVNDAGWVEVSPAAWKRLMAKGFDASLTEEFQAYDDATDQYSVFETGRQHVSVADLNGFVNGIAYTGAAQRQAGLEQLGLASLQALALSKDASGITTDMNAQQKRAFMAALVQVQGTSR